MTLRATPHNRASELALEVYGKVLDAVRADVLVYQALQRVGDTLFVQGRHIDLTHYDRVWVAGSGKASVAMAKAASEVMGERLTGGLIITKAGSAESIAGITVLEASHPVPDETSLQAGAQMLDFAASHTEKDLVIYLLSGGSSALMESPRESISLGDIQETNRQLLASGVDIRAMNAIRSRISRIKAGGLAVAFEPATVICLVLSDVVGNDLNAIGSGPLMKRRQTPFSPLHLNWDKFPAAVRAALIEPHKPAEPSVPVDHLVIGSVSLAIHAAVDAARSVGLRPFPFGDPMKGEARIMTRKICAHATERLLDHSCMIFGGETTVTIKGKGLGGRCQEMALAAAEPVSKMIDTCFLAAGTDGSDGPTDAVGGLVDPESLTRAKAAGKNARVSLANNDSHHYLEACDGLIVSGPTGSNVNDLVLVVHADD